MYIQLFENIGAGTPATNGYFFLSCIQTSIHCPTVFK